MVECDYCDATFSGEENYLAHLRDAHEGELGPIDRRRVEGLEDSDGGLPVSTGVIGLVLAGAIGLVLVLAVFGGPGGGDQPGELPARGDQAVISQVETEPSSGNGHVQPGTEIEYERMPPTSGTHYVGQWTSAGFYTEPQPLGKVVHSLEHGAIVVYYDPAQLSPEAERDLERRARTHTGDWQSFIAVPNPEDDPGSAYVLTAWEKRLTMDEYDPDAVRAFTAEYIGRGPENPVR